MRVPLELVEERRRRLASLIQQRGYVPVGELCREFGISEATARRDLAALAREQKITRTFGGALVDFNLKFPSFQQRQSENAAGKEAMARAARRLLGPGHRVFFDAGTSIFRIAEVLRDQPVRPLTIVTYSLPVAEVLAGVDAFSVHLLGGQLLQRQSVLLGDMTRHALALWKFDLAFLGARALDAEGLWNTPPEVVQLQREVVQRSLRSIFCLDRTKIDATGPHFFFRWSPDFELLTDAPPARLAKAGLKIRPARLIDCPPAN
jgi:DeoR/GlpR family transcriptional regulator of sugar metabolism